MTKKPKFFRGPRLFSPRTNMFLLSHYNFRVRTVLCWSKQCFPVVWKKKKRTSLLLPFVFTLNWSFRVLSIFFSLYIVSNFCMVNVHLIFYSLPWYFLNQYIWTYFLVFCDCFLFIFTLVYLRLFSCNK